MFSSRMDSKMHGALASVFGCDVLLYDYVEPYPPNSSVETRCRESMTEEGSPFGGWDFPEFIPDLHNGNIFQFLLLVNRRIVGTAKKLNDLN